jgi:hypothetical protein
MQLVSGDGLCCTDFILKEPMSSLQAIPGTAFVRQATLSASQVHVLLLPTLNKETLPSCFKDTSSQRLLDLIMVRSSSCTETVLKTRPLGLKFKTFLKDGS